MKSKRDEAVVHVFLSLLGVAREVVVDRARARADAYRMAASAEYHQARIFEARKLASGADFQGTDAERHAELERLDPLSRELAELAR